MKIKENNRNIEEMSAFILKLLLMGIKPQIN